MLEERRDQLPQSWNEEGFRYLDQALLMCEMVDPSTPRSVLVACTAAIKTKNNKENRKRGYEGQIEEPYLVEKFQKKIGPIKRNEQINSQVGVEEAPNKTHEKYLQLHFIPYLQSDRIPVFEASLCR